MIKAILFIFFTSIIVLLILAAIAGAGTARTNFKQQRHASLVQQCMKQMQWEEWRCEIELHGIE